MSIWPLILALLVLLATARALIVGGASAGGDGIRRESEPFAYWAVVVGGACASALLFYIAYEG